MSDDEFSSGKRLRRPRRGRASKGDGIGVSSLQELITRIHDLPMKGQGWIYRGQPDCSHALVPKAGRPPFIGKDDLSLFSEWRRKAVAYLPALSSDEWEALAIAQHHGLATRLLDWTFKYSVATYFAVQSRSSTDGALYCYYPRCVDTGPRPALKDLASVWTYCPPMKASRIVSQEGVFTCHPNPAEPFDPGRGEFGVVRVVIPAKAKVRLLVDLDSLGINEASLFPDLDGLSRHMNWKASLERPSELSDPEFRSRLAAHLLLEGEESALRDDKIGRIVDINRQMGGQ